LGPTPERDLTGLKRGKSISGRWATPFRASCSGDETTLA
jgi:hypothetical protein